MGYNKVADIDDEDQDEQTAGIMQQIAEDWDVNNNSQSLIHKIRTTKTRSETS